MPSADRSSRPLIISILIIISLIIIILSESVKKLSVRPSPPYPHNEETIS